MSTKISEELVEQLATFIEAHSPAEFSISLRSMLLKYQRQNVNAGFPVNFPDFLAALDDLFRLLDMAAEEKKEE